MKYRPGLSGETNLHVERPGDAAIAASKTFTLAGMSTAVTITAVTAGAAGNLIELEFDGEDDIATVLAAWNAANTENTAEVTDGDDEQTPNNETSVTLENGRDAIAGTAEQPALLHSVTRNGGTVTVTGKVTAEVEAEADLSFDITIPPGRDAFSSGDDVIGIAVAVAADGTKDVGYVKAKTSSAAVTIEIPGATMTVGQDVEIRYSFSYEEI
jgi:hypothetical protein